MEIRVNYIYLNRSLVDGPGIRTVVFLQGCDLRCRGCHNVSTWDTQGGHLIKTSSLANYLRNNCINKKITISGGEPLIQKEAVEDLLRYISDFDIALYTGHEYEDVPAGILQYLKYLKTGPYIQELRTTTKPFVGSTNQTFRRLK